MNPLIAHELERLAHDIANVHGSVWIALTTCFAFAMGWLYANDYGFLAFLTSLMLINTGMALGVWAWLNYLHGGQHHG